MSKQNLANLHTPPEHQPLAYFLTFPTYGTWLHGDPRESVDPLHNTPETPRIPLDPIRHAADAKRLLNSPFLLDSAARPLVEATILEVCSHRGWGLIAQNVRTNHVHVVVSAAAHRPERVMSDLKAWTTRRLRDAGFLGPAARAWVHHGSTRYLWKLQQVQEAVDYTLNGQGPDIASEPRT